MVSPIFVLAWPTNACRAGISFHDLSAVRLCDEVQKGGGIFQTEAGIDIAQDCQAIRATGDVRCNVPIIAARDLEYRTRGRRSPFFLVRRETFAPNLQSALITWLPILDVVMQGSGHQAAIDEPPGSPISITESPTRVAAWTISRPGAVWRENFLSAKGVAQEIEKFVDVAIYEIRQSRCGSHREWRS